MAENTARFCPVCKEGMEFISRYLVWRWAQRGLFVLNQLVKHYPLKFGEFTWMRKSGDVYVDRPAYRG